MRLLPRLSRQAPPAAREPRGEGTARVRPASPGRPRGTGGARADSERPGGRSASAHAGRLRAGSPPAEAGTTGAPRAAPPPAHPSASARLSPHPCLRLLPRRGASVARCGDGTRVALSQHGRARAASLPAATAATSPTARPGGPPQRPNRQARHPTRRPGRPTAPRPAPSSSSSSSLELSGSRPSSSQCAAALVSFLWRRSHAGPPAMARSASCLGVRPPPPRRAAS